MKAEDSLIRVVVADDEHLARERIRRLLAREPDMQVVHCAPNGNDALAAIIEHEPDLALLDVQMPGLNGLDVATALLDRLAPAEMPLIVFITAYDQFALEAFDRQALAYLVKPFDDDRFAALLDRVRTLVRNARIGRSVDQLQSLLAGVRAIERGRGAMPEPRADLSTHTDTASRDETTAHAEHAEGPLHRLVLRIGKKSRVVRAEDVDWIGADGVYARVNMGKASYLLRMPLHELEARLDARRFVRIHRSTIVNIDRVRELHEIDRGDYAAVLADGTRLKVSRSRKSSFEARIARSK